MASPVSHRHYKYKADGLANEVKAEVKVRVKFAVRLT